MKTDPFPMTLDDETTELDVCIPFVLTAAGEGRDLRDLAPGESIEPIPPTEPAPRAL